MSRWAPGIASILIIKKQEGRSRRRSRDGRSRGQSHEATSQARQVGSLQKLEKARKGLWPFCRHLPPLYLFTPHLSSSSHLPHGISMVTLSCHTNLGHIPYGVFSQHRLLSLVPNAAHGCDLASGPGSPTLSCERHEHTDCGFSSPPCCLQDRVRWWTLKICGVFLPFFH